MPVFAAMDRTPVIAALEGGVLTLMLNRPQRLNAMSPALIEAMNHELERARDDKDIRAVLLTGIGRGFCAGADLAGSGPGDPDAGGQPDLGAAMDRIFNPMIRAMRALPKPIVAAVNGVAAGGGANLALASRSGSARSAPAQKPRPDPVSSTARTAGSAARSSQQSLISAIILRDTAFSRSGALKVRVARPSFLASRIFS